MTTLQDSGVCLLITCGSAKQWNTFINVLLTWTMSSRDAFCWKRVISPLLICTTSSRKCCTALHSEDTAAQYCEDSHSTAVMSVKFCFMLKKVDLWSTYFAWSAPQTRVWMLYLVKLKGLLSDWSRLAGTFLLRCGEKLYIFGDIQVKQPTSSQCYW